MNDDILLDECLDILNDESEVLIDENDIIDIEENSDYLQESSEPDNLSNQLVINQELIDEFQDFLLEKESDSSDPDESISSDQEESVADYTDILEDIYSQNVNSNQMLFSLQNDLNNDFTKPFEEYNLTEFFMFFTFLFVFVMFLFKTFMRSF